MDTTQHTFLAFLHAAHTSLELFDDSPDQSCTARYILASRHQRLLAGSAEIQTSRECPVASPRQDHHPNCCVPRELAEKTPKFWPDFLRESVELCGPVDFDVSHVLGRAAYFEVLVRRVEVQIGHCARGFCPKFQCLVLRVTFRRQRGIGRIKYCSRARFQLIIMEEFRRG
jgi:hypothetical protein